MPEPLISVEKVAQKFCRPIGPSIRYAMKDTLKDLLGIQGNAALRPDEFWALKNISFEVRRGECLGLIGRNGAGKTTLLRLLNGLLRPHEGKITLRGRVGALIALGAGFHPILSGRENIRVCGSMLGWSRGEIFRRMDEIVEFADLREFIDAPVQTYSSGMQVRLGFAIASSGEPDILLLDEILAVGDASFRARCYHRLGKLQRNAAVIFVSHSMDQVSHVCDRALFLKKGEIGCLGGVDEAVQAYQDENSLAGGEEAFDRLEEPVTEAVIQVQPTTIQHGESIQLKMKLRLSGDLPDAVLRIVFYDSRGLVAAEWNSRRLGKKIKLATGESSMEIPLGPLQLKTGGYRLGIVLNDQGRVGLPLWSFKKHGVEVKGPAGGGCSFQLS